MSADPSAELRYPRVIGEQAARALRLELELGFVPIGGQHLWQLIAERNIDLAFNDFGKKGGDGLYLWNGERGLIVLNTNDKKPTRLRFTAAHELGHHEMHRHTLSSVLLSDIDIMDEQTDTEKEANAFAAEFLAPAIALRREFAGRDSASITPLDVVQLMRTYGLSYDSMLWRLVNSRIINLSDRDRLAQDGQGRVMKLERALRFDEQVVFGAPEEKLPERFVLSALDLFREGAIDDERLSQLLRRPRKDALARAGEMDHASIPTDPSIDELLGLT